MMPMTPDGNPDALELEAVGPLPGGGDIADRIGQCGNFGEAGRHGGDAVVVEGEAIDESVRAVGGAGGLEVSGVGCEDFLAGGQNVARHGPKRGVLGCGRRIGEFLCGGACRFAHRRHRFCNAGRAVVQNRQTHRIILSPKPSRPCGSSRRGHGSRVSALFHGFCGR